MADDEPPFPGPVVVPIEDALDLHPFAPRDVPDVVRDYVEAAAAAGLTEVRVIHGKGHGVQRRRVREVLAAHPLVVAIREATPDRGGSGATIVTLRRPTT
jgi:dsDNA-specific endonuclease/ATPase MutS2